MRRGKLTKKSILLVISAGFFVLFSFFLDQQVIQKEDKVRNVEINIQNKIEKVNELSTNSLTVLMLEERAQTLTNHYTFFSTIFYKTYLNLERDDDFKKHLRGHETEQGEKNNRPNASVSTRQAGKFSGEGFGDQGNHRKTGAIACF